MAIVLTGVVVTVLFLHNSLFGAPAAAASLASAQAQASAINAQLQADSQKVDALSQPMTRHSRRCNN